MKWFINLSTRAKLFLSFGLMIIFLLIVTLAAYTSIQAIWESQKTLAEKDFADALELVELRDDLNRKRGQMQEMIETYSR